MLNRNWLTSDWQRKLHYGTLRTSLPRKTKHKLALAACAWMLLGAALLLTGCATTSCEPAPKQPLPSMPALSEPIPSVSYSEQWRRLVEEWQQSLTFTQTTPKP